MDLPISNRSLSPKVYINLVGQAGAGKTTVANYLKNKYEFFIFRPSDIVRTYAKQQGTVLKGREDYILCHRKMYDEDPEVMTNAIKSIEHQRICVDGLRAPVEVSALRDQCGMVTIALVSPSQQRFERVMAERSKRRNRDASNITTFEAFMADEKADNVSTDKRDPNVGAVLAMADFTIDTSVDGYEVFNRIDQLLSSILK